MVEGADAGGDWKEQFDYYSDPLCHSLSFSVRAGGRYVLVADSQVFGDPGRVVEADFGVDRISVAVWEHRLLDTVDTAGPLDCGGLDARPWQVSESNIFCNCNYKARFKPVIRPRLCLIKADNAEAFT